MLTDTLSDISEPGADVILMTLERGQLNGVGEVRGSS